MLSHTIRLLLALLSAPLMRGDLLEHEHPLLQALPTEEIMSLLVSIVTESEQPYAASRAYHALCALPDADRTGVLLALLPFPRWRWSACRDLAEVPDDRALATLCHLLLEDDENMRFLAADGLGAIGDGRVAPILEHAALTDPGTDYEGRPIREAALASLRALHRRPISVAPLPPFTPPPPLVSAPPTVVEAMHQTLDALTEGPDRWWEIVGGWRQELAATNDAVLLRRFDWWLETLHPQAEFWACGPAEVDRPASLSDEAPTVARIIAWMHTALATATVLSYDAVVEQLVAWDAYILYHPSGALCVDEQVVAAWYLATQDTVVWLPGERAWRQRRPLDPPRRIV